MLRAVLFDWGDTLMRWDWDDAYFQVANEAALSALARDDAPTAAAIGEYFRDRPELISWAGEDEVDYPEVMRAMLGHLGCAVDDDDLERYLEAQYWSWVDSAIMLGATTYALLESLRARGLKLGLVSNAFDPPRLLHANLERMGVAERLDVAVFSSEVGKRKPHRVIFERALQSLDVDPEDALFVGDRRVQDVGGAAQLGMKTVQAVWFRADENPDGAEPDYVAFTPYDVLNIVNRLRA